MTNSAIGQRPLRTTLGAGPIGDEGPGAYRAFFRVHPQEGVRRRVLEQTHVWLREKGWDPDLERDGFQQRDDRELFVLHHEAATSANVRIRMREDTTAGEWRTELTLSDSRLNGSWMSIAVSNSENRFVDVPRVAKYILDVLEGFDGPCALTSEPTLISASGVDDLADELCSEERGGLLLVAGTSHDSALFAPFRQQVARWTRQTRGLARVVVLDPNATEALTAAVGNSHDVKPWTIRTYLPGMDPAVALDGRRHRVLGHSTLAQRPDHQIERILGRAARRHASARGLPDEVVRASRALDRLESRVALSALKPETIPEPSTTKQVEALEPIRHVDDEPAVLTPPLSEQNSGDLAVEVAAYLDQVDLVRTVLGIESLDERTLRELAERAARGGQVELASARIERRLEDLQSQLETLQDENASYKNLTEEQYLDLTEAERVNARLADEARWLRNRLSEAKDFEAAYGAVPDSAYSNAPESFEQLLGRVAELSSDGVVFTADPRKAQALDDHDPFGKLATRAWEYLLVLRDYLRARATGASSSGLDGYLAHTPDGFRTVPARRFAGTETGRTMKSFGDERRLPVPSDVDASGTATMKAHFKLGQVGMVSPRMYVLDRYATDGKVYVGYLGEHLTNTQTN